jgi:nicotinamide riboside transporter PnuC
LRWNTWQAGLYNPLETACSNFLLGASFSSKFVWTKKRFHHDALRILACQFKKKNRVPVLSLVLVISALQNFVKD